MTSFSDLQNASAYTSPQIWKSVKEDTDKCLAQLDKAAGPEPIQLNACEGLINSIAMAKDTTSVLTLPDVCFMLTSG